MRNPPFELRPKAGSNLCMEPIVAHPILAHSFDFRRRWTAVLSFASDDKDHMVFEYDHAPRWDLTWNRKIDPHAMAWEHFLNVAKGLLTLGAAEPRHNGRAITPCWCSARERSIRSVAA